MKRKDKLKLAIIVAVIIALLGVGLLVIAYLLITKLGIIGEIIVCILLFISIVAWVYSTIDKEEKNG